MCVLGQAIPACRFHLIQAWEDLAAHLAHMEFLVGDFFRPPEFRPCR